LWEPLDPSWPLLNEDYQFTSLEEEGCSSPESLAAADTAMPTEDTQGVSRPAKRGRKCTSVLPKKDRNRESALKYRQRKKEHVHTLEAQVSALAQLVEDQQRELTELRADNKIMTQQLAFVKGFMASGLAAMPTALPAAAAPVSAPLGNPTMPSACPLSAPPLPSASPFSASSAASSPCMPMAPLPPPCSSSPSLAKHPPHSHPHLLLPNNPRTHFVFPPRAVDPAYFSLFAHPSMYLGLLGCCLILAPNLPSGTSASPRGRVLLTHEVWNEWQVYLSSLLLLVRTLSSLLLHVALLFVGAVVLGLVGSRGCAHLLQKLRASSCWEWTIAVSAWRPDLLLQKAVD